MDLTPYITSLREDLTATASAGDDQTRRAAAVLSTALEPSVRLALMNALSDLAAEVTAHLDDHIVEVRLDGRDVRVVVTSPGGSDHPDPTEPSPPPPPPPPGDGGDISRITLRLFEEIKNKAEQAAAAQGVSLNTYVSQAVQGALHGGAGEYGRGRRGGKGPWGPPSGRRGGRSGGNRVHGWVQG
ncbi:MAG: toxin-antitoxin system HicB family antitoxin [Pseudonocardiaceae bacterium]